MTTGLVPGDEHMNTQPSRTRQLQDGSMAMQISDRRVAPRFRVQFRTFLTDQHSMSEHMGTILDLSVTGCRVESLVPVQQSAVMELRIYVPDLDWPLMVDRAVQATSWDTRSLVVGSYKTGRGGTSATRRDRRITAKFLLQRLYSNIAQCVTSRKIAPASQQGNGGHF
jgi:hypothetical protein